MKTINKKTINPVPLTGVTAAAGCVIHARLADKTPVLIRPICPQDEPLMVKFHQTLSEETVYHRYFGVLKLSQRVAHERLSRICFPDYERDIVLVAEGTNPGTGAREILAVGRLSRVHTSNEGEFALLVSDACQKQGLGTALLKRLVQIGRGQKLTRITALIMSDNHAMQHVAKKAGFKLVHDPGGHDFQAEYTLEYRSKNL
jgi:acetyltransferase